MIVTPEITMPLNPTVSETRNLFPGEVPGAFESGRYGGWIEPNKKNEIATDAYSGRLRQE